MSDHLKQLQEDIEQLKKLLLDAERPNIQNFLSQHLSHLKTEHDNLKSSNASDSPKKLEKPTISPTHNDIDKKAYVSLTKYAWDQQGTKVKIIFSLDGVGTECTKQQVEVLFDTSSVEMRLQGYKQQNLIFAIKKLSGDIVPAQSKFLLKNNSITIILIKKENKSWAQLPFKEDKIPSKKEEKEEEKDPSAGIMNMMKKMYEEGDENTRRMIAETWTKANDKKEKGEKGEQPDFSDRYDFLNKK